MRIACMLEHRLLQDGECSIWWNSGGLRAVDHRKAYRAPMQLAGGIGMTEVVTWITAAMPALGAAITASACRVICRHRLPLRGDGCAIGGLLRSLDDENGLHQIDGALEGGYRTSCFPTWSIGARRIRQGRWRLPG